MSSYVAPAAGLSAMWRSKTSSTLTLLLTLAMVNYFSKPQSAADSRGSAKSDSVRSGSKSKPRVDTVRDQPAVQAAEVQHRQCSRDSQHRHNISVLAYRGLAEM